MSPEIDPHVYCHLIYDKVSVKFGGKIIIFQQIVLGQLISMLEKINLDTYIKPYKTKIINSGCIADLGEE